MPYTKHKYLRLQIWKVFSWNTRSANDFERSIFVPTSLHALSHIGWCHNAGYGKINVWNKNLSVTVCFRSKYVWIFYRPQRSCGKVMFLHLSVSHSVHRGRAWHAHPATHTPLPCLPPCHTCPTSHACPPATHAPLPMTSRHAVNERAVRILLECILVSS